MVERHLVIFVKAPRVGAVKTRLAQGIGSLASWQFYRRTTNDLLRRLKGGRWRVWLAVTPDEYAGQKCFWPGDQERLAQGRGDLGQRMARPMHDLPPGPVVIVGSDIPDISRLMIEKAFNDLNKSDVVVGPANDGGYWLIGMRRRPARAFRLFDNIRWSSEHALTDTLAGLDRKLSVARIDTLNDIDTPSDYREWRERNRS
jgi:hypothetical protein